MGRSKKDKHQPDPPGDSEDVVEDMGAAGGAPAVPTERSTSTNARLDSMEKAIETLLARSTAALALQSVTPGQPVGPVEGQQPDASVRPVTPLVARPRNKSGSYPDGPWKMHRPHKGKSLYESDDSSSSDESLKSHGAPKDRQSKKSKYSQYLPYAAPRVVFPVVGREGPSNLEGDFILFERTAKQAQIDPEFWSTILNSHLDGEAKRIAQELDEECALDYWRVKEIILEHFAITPEHHRLQFRKMVKFAKESYKTFYSRLHKHSIRWLKPKNLDTEEGQRIFEAVELEQLMEGLDPTIRQEVERKYPSKMPSIAKLTQLCDLWTITKNESAKRQEQRLPAQTQKSRQQNQTAQGNDRSIPNQNKNSNSNNKGKGRFSNQKPHAGPQGKSGGNTSSEARSQPAKPYSKPFQQGSSAPQVQPSAPQTRSGVTCYTCGEPGHIRPDCPQRAFRSNFVALANGDRSPNDRDPHNKVMCGLLFGKPANILLDTGATLSLVDEKFIAGRQQEGSTQIVCVCNHTTGCGIYEVPIQIGSFHSKSYVAAMPNLAYDMIFGADLLKEIPQYQDWHVNFDMIGDTAQEVVAFARRMTVQKPLSYANALKQAAPKTKPVPSPQPIVKGPAQRAPNPKSKRSIRKALKSKRVTDRRAVALYSTAPVAPPPVADAPVKFNPFRPLGTEPLAQVKKPKAKAAKTKKVKSYGPPSSTDPPASRSKDRRHPLLKVMPPHGSFPPDVSKPPTRDPSNRTNVFLGEDWSYARIPAGASPYFDVESHVALNKHSPKSAWQDARKQFAAYVDDLSVFTPAVEETLRQQKQDPSLLNC